MKGFFGRPASAVRYVHEKNLVHGDIKPANILISRKTPPGIVLSDFGASGPNTDTAGMGGKKWQLTLRYAAPETAVGSLRGSKSDRFSLGCVFFEMAAVLFSEHRSQLADFRREFEHQRHFYNEQPAVHRWLKMLKEHAESDAVYILDTIANMVQEDQRDRPTTEVLSRTFLPHACCVAWPGWEVVHRGSVSAAIRLALTSSATTKFPVGVRQFSGEAKQQARVQNSPPKQLANRWLRICQHSHKSCVRSQSGFLPAFLLEIGGGESTSVRLICTNTTSVSDTRYAALSCVWLDCSQIRLSRANEKILQQAVDVRSLAAPVGSAIAFAGRVGLWVDRLCTAEEDGIGGQERAPPLGNAFVVISAPVDERNHNQLESARREGYCGSSGLANAVSAISRFERAWDIPGKEYVHSNGLADSEMRC
jgi:Protein kinase domain